mmetsp:Transcript_23267/g.44301  ORF Transcript_23267/g.44301 Transcript_23267/m.44301 type:complete len:149 (+) Transcript_23267:262-708(+)
MKTKRKIATTRLTITTMTTIPLVVAIAVKVCAATRNASDVSGTLPWGLVVFYSAWDCIFDGKVKFNDDNNNDMNDNNKTPPLTLKKCNKSEMTLSTSGTMETSSIKTNHSRQAYAASASNKNGMIGLLCNPFLTWKADIMVSQFCVGL